MDASLPRLPLLDQPVRYRRPSWYSPPCPFPRDPSTTNTPFTAKTFYTEALNWTFRTTHTRSDGIIEDPNAIAHFDHGATCPAGGITKVDEVLRTEGKGGCVLYLFVEDLGMSFLPSTYLTPPGFWMLANKGVEAATEKVRT